MKRVKDHDRIRGWHELNADRPTNVLIRCEKYVEVWKQESKGGFDHVHRDTTADTRVPAGSKREVGKR
jgi:hypothetical protein